MSERPSKTQKIVDDSIPPPPLGETAAAAAAMAEAVAAAAGASVDVSPAPETYAPGNNPSWDHRLNQLREFKAATGHTNVPNRYPANPQLATWVAEQCRHYKVISKEPTKKSSLSQERIRILEEMGFRWSIQESLWDERLQELMKYRAEHGSCNVPNKWKENPSLGKWVNAQRQYYRIRNEGKATSITAERIAKLEAIGFEWTLRSLTPWETRLEELKAYKEKHGHVLVPQKDKEHRGLARWVDTQRQQARMKRDGKKSQMTDDRIAQLDAIGMKWVTIDPKSWESHYQDLKEYKARNGDCYVPMRKDDPKLGEWVGQQRKAYRLKMDGKQSAMTDERMEKLNKIGFTWRLRKRKTHPECEDEGGNGANARTHAGDDVGKSEEETATAVVEQVAKHLAASSANAEEDAQVHVEV